MPPLKNTRHETIAQRLTLGESQVNIEKELGLSQGYVSRLQSKNVLISDRIAEIKGRLALKVEEKQLVSATKLHERWSEMFQADIADIMTTHGSYKPIHEWPKVWRQMLTGLDVKELFEHSKDGQGASWDKIGEVVKLKFMAQKDLGELLGKHKAVDAFVATKQDTTNILVVSAEQARKVSRSVDRLDKYLASTGEVIDAQAEETGGGEPTGLDRNGETLT